MNGQQNIKKVFDGFICFDYRLLFAAFRPKKKCVSFECTIHVNNSELHKNYRYASRIKTSDVELLPTHVSQLISSFLPFFF